MKLLVTARQNTPEAEVDPRFGRAEFFIIFDSLTEKWEVVDNSTNRDAAHGAGVQSAQMASQHGVDAVLTGDCGPKASGLLEGDGIKIVSGVSGTVKEAVKNYLDTIS